MFLDDTIEGCRPGNGKLHLSISATTVELEAASLLSLLAMYGAIPDLEIPNVAGACWTCISRFGEGRGDVNDLCDKKLPGLQSSLLGLVTGGEPKADQIHPQYAEHALPAGISAKVTTPG